MKNSPFFSKFDINLQKKVNWLQIHSFMLHSLEIIENIQITQLNFEKILFGWLPKSRNSSGTQCLKKAPILLFSCCWQFLGKRTIISNFLSFSDQKYLSGPMIWFVVCQFVLSSVPLSICCVVLVTFIYCFPPFAPLYISCIIHFFKELWSFVIRF